MEINLGHIITIVIMLVGAAVGYGSLRRAVENNLEALEEVQKQVKDAVPFATCVRQHDEMHRIYERQAKLMSGLNNFARWWLAVQGKNPKEINDILLGDGDGGHR